jgi:hypothetical protein
MNKKIIIVFALFAVLFGAHLLLKSKRAGREQAQSWEMPKLEGLTKVEIAREGETIVLEKSATGWNITAPIKFTAAANVVSEIEALFTKSQLVDQSRVIAEGSGAVGLYDGATPKPVKLTLTAGSAVTKLSLGRTVSVEQTGKNLTWVQPDGSDKAYRVGADLRSVFDKSAKEFRELQLTDFDASKVTELTFDGPTKVKLVKKGDAWEATEPAGAKVDSELVGRIVPSVAKLRGSEIVETVTADTAGVTTTGRSLTLKAGDQSVTLRLGNQVAPASAEPSEGGKKFYLVRDGLDAVYLVPDFVGKKVATDLGDLLPRKVLSLADNEVASMEFVDSDGAITIKGETAKGEGSGAAPVTSFTVVNPAKLVADKAVVERMVRAMTSLDATRFATGATAESAGLIAPRRTITLTAADGSKKVLKLGGPVAPPATPEGESARFAQLDAGPIFELSQYKVEMLLTKVAGLLAKGDTSE